MATEISTTATHTHTMGRERERERKRERKREREHRKARDCSRPRKSKHERYTSELIWGMSRLYVAAVAAAVAGA